MKAVLDLFSTDYGLMSLVVIACVLVMSVWFSRFFARKVAESAAQAKAQADRSSPGTPAP